MRRTNSKETVPPPNIWKRVWNTLEEISDEVGEEHLNADYILRFEGWGGFCVEEMWWGVEEEQERRGMDINSKEAEEEREEACHEYAEEQSYGIIECEWKPELKNRGFHFIDGGYDEGALYGRTWALFKKDAKEVYKADTVIAERFLKKA